MAFDKYCIYIQRLSRDREWGGTAELLALSSLLQTTIHTFVGSPSSPQRTDITWETFKPRTDLPPEMNDASVDRTQH